ncbi:MAG: cupin domain-containing protein [Nocardioides sp.]|uniref:JmjC domain-containing protein n=1 Tax=Nocardioides sp. TaxID=35761 RepID=UPI0039E6AC7C
MADVVDILVDGRARFPHVVMTLGGKPLSPSEFTGERIINGTPSAGFVEIPKVEGLLKAGASIVFNELEAYWPVLAKIVALVERATGVEIGAMAFLSPPGLGAFPLHQDPVHVVVIQCNGEKRWQVYDHVEGNDVAGPVMLRGDASVAHDMILGVGDVFSMPAAHPHQAQSSETYSLHVSLTAKVRSGRSALRSNIRAAASALPDDLPLEALTERFISELRAMTNTKGTNQRVEASAARQRLTSLMGAS